MKKISKIDLARMAAFIDGEGCLDIVAIGKGGYLTARLAVTNTDYRLMVWMKERFGGCVSRNQPPKSRNRKQVYKWSVTSKTACEILSLVYPYMILKQDRADVIFEFQSYIGKSRTVPWFVAERKKEEQKKLKVLNFRGLPPEEKAS